MVVNVHVYDQASMGIAREKIIDLLRERHRLAPNQENDFTVQPHEQVAALAVEASAASCSAT